MKIFNAGPGLGRKLSQQETNEFLSSCRMNLQFGSTDVENVPNIHPVWYIYENGKIFFATEIKSRKIQNIKYRDTVYFSVSTEKEPYINVRGKGKSVVLVDTEQNSIIAKKIIQKYLGNSKSILADEIIQEISNGIEVIVEIRPLYFSTCRFNA